jgi:hypothetical protein
MLVSPAKAHVIRGLAGLLYEPGLWVRFRTVINVHIY